MFHRFNTWLDSLSDFSVIFFALLFSAPGFFAIVYNDGAYFRYGVEYLGFIFCFRLGYYFLDEHIHEFKHHLFS